MSKGNSKGKIYVPDSIIDQAKEEVTVELFEAMVPIPITVRGDHVRVLEKEAN